MTKLISEVICFLLGIDPSQSSDRDLMEVEDHGKTDRERQKLIREQNILKQVCVFFSFVCCDGVGRYYRKSSDFVDLKPFALVNVM